MIQLLTYGNTFCSIEHSIDKNAKEHFLVLQLKKTKKELVIADSKSFQKHEEVFTHLQSQKHAFLIVNNQQVLLKKVISVDENKELVVKKAFPTIKLADFYFEVVTTLDHSFVAVCRKEYIDNLIKTYESKGIFIIDFSLQNLMVCSLLPYINNEEIYTLNNKLICKGEQAVDIEKSVFKEVNYSINDLEIPNKYLGALSGILAYFYRNNSNISNFKEKGKELFEYYKRHRFFSIGLKVSLGILFAILLVNYLIFTNTHTKGSVLNEELAENNAYKNKLTQLQNRVEKKSQLTKSLASSSSFQITRFLNELGRSVPPKTSLKELSYQPLNKSIKKNKDITVSMNTIVVKGNSRNSNSFTKWISYLEQKKWVQKVEIISYGKGKNTFSSSFEFLIYINN